MLELTTLKFGVDTSALVEAKKAFQDLAVAQEQVNKPTKQSTNSGGNTRAQKESTDVLTRNKALLGDLVDGFSRWESRQLQAFKGTSAGATELKNTLTEVRKFTEGTLGGNTGPLRSINDALEQVRNRARLAQEGVAATAKELRDFGRIPFQVEGEMRKQGSNGDNAQVQSFRVNNMQNDFIAKAKEVAAYRGEEQKNIAVTKQNAAAQGFLTQEMSRVDSVLKEMNSTFGLNAATQERGANAVAKFGVNLQRSGKSIEEQTKLLNQYRGKITEVSRAEEIAAGKRLSNALAPQISDVAVSAVGGMPLHLIMLQQGLQIRDLIAQSRVGTETVKQSMKTAGTEMVASIGQTITALGSLVFGTVVDAGKAFVNFGMEITGVNSILNKTSSIFPQLAGSIQGFKSILGALVGTALIGAVAAIVLLGVELYKMIGFNNELSVSLSGSAGSFGAGYSATLKYVEGLSSASITMKDTKEVILGMTSAGNLSIESFQLVSKAAVDMSTYAGVAIKDTVQNFSNMAKDPVSNLIELAKRTGDVSPTVIQLARDLVVQGESAAAASLGISTLADVNQKQVARIKAEISPLTQMFIDLKKAWTGWISEQDKGAAKMLGGGSSVDKAEQKLADTTRQIDKIKSRMANGFNALGGSRMTPELLKRDNDSLLILQKRLITEGDSFNMLRLTQKVESEQQEARAKAVKRDEERHNTRMKYSKEYRLQQGMLALDADLNRGDISPTDYKREKKKLEDGVKDKDVEKASNSAKTYGLSIQEKINDAYNATIAKAVNLTKIEQALNDVKDDPKFKSKSEAEKKDFIDKALVRDKEAQFIVLQASNFEDLKKLREADTEDFLGDLYVKKKAILDTASLIGTISAKEYTDLLNLAFQTTPLAKKMQENKGAYDASKTSLGYKSQELDISESMQGKTDDTRARLQAEYDLKKSFGEASVQLAKDLAQAEKDPAGSVRTEAEKDARELFAIRLDLATREKDIRISAMSEMSERQKNFDGVFKQGFEKLGESILDFAATGKSSFGDMVSSMIKDLLRLEMKMQMMKLYESSSGGGSLFGKLIGGVVGLFNGGNSEVASSVVSAVTPSGEGGGFTGGGARSGGVDGRGGFNAILHPNETVIDHTKTKPLSQGNFSMGGGSTSVVINNFGNEKVQQKESTDSRGNRKLEFTIGDMSAGEIQRNGSTSQSAMRGTYGLRPALINR